MDDYNDGKWHRWNGGECPVHPASVVDVFRSACGVMDEAVCASNLCWEAGFGGDNIFAFRVRTAGLGDEYGRWLKKEKAYTDGTPVLAVHKDWSGVFIARFGEYADGRPGWFCEDYSYDVSDFDLWTPINLPDHVVAAWDARAAAQEKGGG